MFYFTEPESCISLEVKIATYCLFYFIPNKIMLLIVALKTMTALGGATTRTSLPITDADQDIHNYFAAQQDNIRGVIDRAVSTDV